MEVNMKNNLKEATLKFYAVTRTGKFIDFAKDFVDKTFNFEDAEDNWISIPYEGNYYDGRITKINSWGDYSIEVFLECNEATYKMATIGNGEQVLTEMSVSRRIL